MMRTEKLKPCAFCERQTEPIYEDEICWATYCQSHPSKILVVLKRHSHRANRKEVRHIKQVIAKLYPNRTWRFGGESIPEHYHVHEQFKKNRKWRLFKCFMGEPEITRLRKANELIEAFRKKGFPAKIWAPLPQHKTSGHTHVVVLSTFEDYVKLGLGEKIGGRVDG